MTAALIRTEPNCDSSLTKAALSSVGSMGVLFQPRAGHPGSAAVLPRGAGQAPDNIAGTQWGFVRLGAPVTWGR